MNTANAANAKKPRNHELALTYGRAGLSVFPCLPNKAPAIKRGFKSAETDADQINEMWLARGNAPVGLPCGEANDLTVIDLDMCKVTGAATGEAGIKAIMPELFGSDGELTIPATRTPSGGLHLYFRFTLDLKTGQVICLVSMFARMAAT